MCDRFKSENKNRKKKQISFRRREKNDFPIPNCTETNENRNSLQLINRNYHCVRFNNALGKRGKGKKKKRRALMKILLIGAVLKAKIELLLKIIATHLQVKFFIIAVIGLIVNIARFWVDLKRGHQPQKVSYL